MLLILLLLLLILLLLQLLLLLHSFFMELTEADLFAFELTRFFSFLVHSGHIQPNSEWTIIFNGRR